jgi:hypothetical protein
MQMRLRSVNGHYGRPLTGGQVARFRKDSAKQRGFDDEAEAVTDPLPANESYVTLLIVNRYIDDPTPASRSEAAMPDSSNKD